MKTLSQTCMIATTVLALGASTAQGATIADNFTSFFAFGDSLTDQGNVSAATGGAVPGPAYFDGRFSNGPIWVDPVMEAFDAQAKINVNFAFGGAKAVVDADQSPDFPVQLAGFGATALPALQGDNPLASVFFGGNDLLALGSSLDPVGDAKKIAQSYGATIDNLVGLGINNIALWNAPDISVTPRVQLFEPQNAATLTLAVDAFNTQLAVEADRLRTPDVNIFEIDLANIFGDLFADPASFGIIDLTFPCLSISGDVCANPSEVAFFDPFHPNTQLHGVLTQAFVGAVNPIPVPASALLLLAAVGALGVARRTARA